MSPALLILKIYTTFKHVQMILEIFFDNSTGFRFSKISVECSVHLCSSPCSRIRIGHMDIGKSHCPFLLVFYKKHCGISIFFFLKLVLSRLLVVFVNIKTNHVLVLTPTLWAKVFKPRVQQLNFLLQWIPDTRK